jgi:hypothetical protein
MAGADERRKLRRRRSECFIGCGYGGFRIQRNGIFSSVPREK